MIKIAVLYGGVSSEREVSLSSGKGVIEALQKSEKFKVQGFDTKNELEKFVSEAQNFDVAFPMLHGEKGEDGTIQGLCELLNLKYVGSGVQASANAIDKIMAKKLYRLAELPVASDFTIRKKQKMPENKLGYPVVIKAATQGSSVGVYIAKNEQEYQESVAKAFEYDEQVLVEKFLEGMEITVAVIGAKGQEKSFEPIEIVANAGEFYDFESKYASGGSTHIIPARIESEQIQKAKEYALRAHQALNCRHISRSDLFVTKNGLFLTETNTIPGFTPTSLVPDAAQYAGISYEQLCEQLVLWAMED